MSYFANDSETRYLTKNVPVVTGDSTNGSGQITLNCENNSHGVKIKGPPHSAAASYTLTLPNDDGTSSQVLSTDGSGVLSWANQPDISVKANLASPTFTGTVAIPNIANLETAITANTAKVTNATHTGDVTGSTTLTIATGAVQTGMIADDAVTTDKLANAINTDIASKAPSASPTFTGVPAAPTAAQGTDTTQVATTAFVNAEIAADLTAAIGSTVQAFDADTAKRDTTNTYTQLQTMNADLVCNEALSIERVTEKVDYNSSGAATGAINLDVKTQTIIWDAGNATANFTLNVRGDSSATLDSLMSIGQALTTVYIVNYGSTAYYPTAVTVDSSAPTVKWVGGAPTAAGTVNSITNYTLTIVKTGNAAFTVFASTTTYE
jgi:hypothetical protein